MENMDNILLMNAVIDYEENQDVHHVIRRRERSRSFQRIMLHNVSVNVSMCSEGDCQFLTA